MIDKNMVDKQKIITHPGSAHFDEVTAVSLILAVSGDADFTIERREPAEDELDNPEMWVVDIGDRYEPEKRNFDHHQSLECPASFILVARYLGLEEMLSAMPWWNFKNEVDRFGPTRASVKYDAGDDLVNRNPVEDWLTAGFAASPREAIPVLRNFGRYLIDSARLLSHQIEVWKSGARLDIKGVPAIISETRDSAGLEEFRRIVADPPDIVISLDRRDDGWRLFRYEGTMVDFTLISGEPEVAFVHKTGFLAKTRERIGTDALVKLLSKAVTGTK